MSRRLLFTCLGVVSVIVSGCGKKGGDTQTASAGGGASSSAPGAMPMGMVPPGMNPGGAGGAPGGAPGGNPMGSTPGAPPGYMQPGGAPGGNPMGATPMPGGAGYPGAGQPGANPMGYGPPPGTPGVTPMPGGAGYPGAGQPGANPMGYGPPPGTPGVTPMPGGAGYPTGDAGANPMGYGPPPGTPGVTPMPGAPGYGAPGQPGANPMGYGPPPGTPGVTPMPGAPGYGAPGQPGANPMGYGPPPGTPGVTPMPGAPGYGAPGQPGANPMGYGPPPGTPGATPMPGAPGYGAPGQPGANPMGYGPPPGTPGANPMGPGGEFPGAPGYPGGAGPAPNQPPPEPKTLSDFVRLAISEGRDGDAYQLLHLDAIASGKSLETMRWYPGIKRNAVAIRFGVGIVYTGTRAISGPEPIGGGRSSGPGGPGMMPGGPGMMPGGPPGGPGGQQGNRRQRNQRGYGQGQGQDPNQQQTKPELFKAPTEPGAMFAFYTGELGDKVLKQLGKRFEKGDFGLAMKEASKVRPAVQVPTGQGGYPGAPGINPMGPGGGPGGAPGMVPGMAPGMMPGGMGGAPDAAAANGDQLLPGVTMLGEGRESDLLKKAVEEGVDVLILFELDVKAAGSTVNNRTTISFINAATKQPIHTSAALSNVQVAKLREEKKSGAEDPVDAELKKVFDVVDERLVGVPFKANADPAKVAVFVDTLVEQKRTNPLPALAEVRFFRSKELITPEKLVEAYGKILGKESGEKVAGGDAAAVMESLAKWLPERRPAALVPGGEGGESDEKKPGIFSKLFGK